MTPTPFQGWFASILQTRGWSLQEAARRLGVSGTTPFHYKEGTMLPSTRMQRRLAELSGTPVERLARIVWDSKDTASTSRQDRREANALPGPTPKRSGAGIRRDRVRSAWRWRARPLGVMFTMYRSRAVRPEHLERLHALATARGTGIEKTLDEALRIALPIMERTPMERTPRPRAAPPPLTLPEAPA